MEKLKRRITINAFLLAMTFVASLWLESCAVAVATPHVCGHNKDFTPQEEDSIENAIDGLKDTDPLALVIVDWKRMRNENTDCLEAHG